MMIQTSREELLQAYAALPETYQPAWGLEESGAQAKRACDDRLAVVIAAAAAFPSGSALRVLDIGCAQGYFSLALKQALQARGREAEVTGVDYLEDNIQFCARLAAHHGLDARFIHDCFDEGFFERHAMPDFDVVLALNVLHHIRELGGAESAEAALTTIRAHSSALLCEVAQADEALDWIGDWHESDHALLHGYAFCRRLGSFPTHLTDVPRPLYACSNRLAYVDERWFAFDTTHDRAHAGVSTSFAGQRRFFIGADTVVKAYRGDGEYAAFNRAELGAEAQALAALDGEPARFPRVLAQADDGDTLWLARGKLPGKLVSELIDEGVAFDRDAWLRALLGELAHLQERGYHHADIRAWNMLWNNGALRLIDFGSMTTKASALHRIALAAVMTEIARGKLSHAQPWYAAVHPLENYPPAWRGVVGYLLGCPLSRFRYAEALALLDARNDTSEWMSAQSYASMICPDILAASAHEQIDGFQRLHEHAEETRRLYKHAQTHANKLQQALWKQSEEATAHARELEKARTVAAAYAASLEERIEREAEDASAERAAAQVALADAASYAQSLESERARLNARIQELDEQLERMRRRFRLLKPLWPRDTKGQ